MTAKTMLVLAAMAALNLQAAEIPALVPMPRSVKAGEGTYRWKGACVDRTCATFVTDMNIVKEGYDLSVTTGGIKVVSSGDAGAFYAVQTLKQLATKEKDGFVFPCVEIKDSPIFSWRGSLLDDCRHFFGKETVKRLIDQMAMHKMNVLHWHLTDDQGWRLDIPSHPELVKYGATRPCSPAHGARAKNNDHSTIERNGETYGPFFYSEADIREIIDYASARFVAIVPEIELPGHAFCALAAHPELACKPENLAARTPRTCWGIEKDVLCVGNDDGIRLYEDILDYVCRVFPSKIIHIGGDECPTVRWKDCPKCQARARAVGLETTDRLQEWTTKHFAKFLAARGRRIIGWDEILLGDLPKSAIGMRWRMSSKGGAGHNLVTPAAAIARGYDMVMCPTAFCYVDYGQGLPDDPYDYIGGRITLEKAYAFDPMEGLEPGCRAHVLGGQCNNWSEFTWNRFDLEWKMWPRGCAIAEALWTAPQKRDFAAFEKRMEVHRRRLLAQHINCAPLR